MKIEVIAKKNHSYQFSNIILYVIISSFLFVSSRKIEKFFKIVCCSPSEHIFLRNDFDSAFYQGWFGTIHTRQLYARILYTQEAQHSPRGRRQPSRCQKPAAPQLFSIRFIFSLFFLSALFFLSLSLSISIQRRGHLKTGIRK